MRMVIFSILSLVLLAGSALAAPNFELTWAFRAEGDDGTIYKSLGIQIDLEGPFEDGQGYNYCYFLKEGVYRCGQYVVADTGYFIMFTRDILGGIMSDNPSVRSNYESWQRMIDEEKRVLEPIISEEESLCEYALPAGGVKRIPPVNGECPIMGVKDGELVEASSDYMLKAAAEEFSFG